LSSPTWTRSACPGPGCRGSRSSRARAAAGLLLGLLGLRPLGIAAAAGLVLFFAGALATHARARVFYNIAVPGAFFALAVASMALAIVVQAGSS
jgi:hypothetical protein